jgi:hypothetical protein
MLRTIEAGLERWRQAYADGSRLRTKEAGVEER